MTQETVAAPATKNVKEILKVTMGDQRIVEFAGKRKVLKEVLSLPEGPAIRFDFVNGETRTYVVPEQHRDYACGHGYGQKIGDNFAGMKDDAGNPVDVDDMVIASDELHERLLAGSEWNVAGGGRGGTSILLRALVELQPSKTKDQIYAFLKGKDDDQKKALANLPAVKAVIRRLQDEADAKKTKDIDGNALLGELEAA